MTQEQILIYKNLSITIADLNFSQFSYKKKVLGDHKMPSIFIKCQDKLIKVEVYHFFSFFIAKVEDSILQTIRLLPDPLWT